MASWVKDRIVEIVLGASHMVNTSFECLLRFESDKCRDWFDELIILILNQFLYFLLDFINL